MGKKQTRVNRGARTGGHERSATAETKQQPKSAPTPETLRAIRDEPDHKKERKFGHN
ncbi:hypothetical protein [Streptomyces purpureus]|uniref:Uncharacterized protein n=1 Tax=Streptomyces purpureus TaxID=1951 RepID=A0A918GYC9_9ACTN|nr:hypothetical protein [Streptomyces purpureus]GGT14594.1 hypothetical protein GCM10014713_04170 [Streptomyces purpureus]